MASFLGAFPHSFLALHPCGTQTTVTYDNAFYTSHINYQIQFGILRYNMYRSSSGRVVENLYATILLLQHSTAKVDCNIAAGAM